MRDNKPACCPNDQHRWSLSGLKGTAPPSGPWRIRQRCTDCRSVRVITVDNANGLRVRIVRPV